MALEQIKTSIFTRLEGLVGLPTIYYPNTGGTVPTTDYIRPDVLPADTAPYDLNHTDIEGGIFQVSIFIEKGKGELEAARVAQILLDGFTRNLQLTSVRFNRSGSVAASFFDGAWQVTPVTFTYQNIS